MVELDAVDKKIILELLEEPKASLRSLAASVGIALGTASSRLKSLQDRGIIKGWLVDLDPAAIGWEMTVIVGLRIEKGQMMEVQPRVFSVYDVTGDFDSIAMARVRNREQLNALTKEVFSNDGIIRSFTHVVLNTVKESSVVPPF
jgi:DNA-binding Lrp family transcriptional regulator